MLDDLMFLTSPRSGDLFMPRADAAFLRAWTDSPEYDSGAGATWAKEGFDDFCAYCMASV